MDTSLVEIYTFVKMIPPFDLLSESVLESVVHEMRICYVRREQQLPPKGVEDPRLYLLRTGALRLQAENGQLLEKYSEGDSCAIFCFENSQHNSVYSEEDALLYSISFEKLITLVADFPDVIAFFKQSASERLSQKMSRNYEEALVNSSLMNSSIANFSHAAVATIDAQESIEDAAQKMTELDFSCLVVYLLSVRKYSRILRASSSVKLWFAIGDKYSAKSALAASFSFTINSGSRIIFIIHSGSLRSVTPAKSGPTNRFPIL